jgi:hypothetical protein
MDDAVRIAQVLTALAAIAAVGVAWWQAAITRNMAADQHHLLQEDLKTRLLLRYEERFDAPDMLLHRRTLANRLFNFGVYLPDKPIVDGQYNLIGDEVPGFFESMGAMLRRGDLEVELVWIFFDHYARHYWAALTGYVREDRRRHGDDVWEEFAGLVKALEQYHAKKYGKPPDPIDQEAIRTFLTQESQVGQ